MKKTYLLLSLLMLTLNSFSQENMTKTIYDFKVKSLDGKDFDFSSLKGKKVMIVNTASECGYTPQYTELEQLYKKYSSRNFVVIGFPANNFGGQEPGTNEDIAKFCSKNYGVTFPMMSKISAKGDDIAPVYKYLTSKSENGMMDSEVKWNFQKYLINEEGKLEKMLPSKVSPLSEEITSWIEGKSKQ